MLVHYVTIILISNYHDVAINSYHLELSARGPWLSNQPTARGMHCLSEMVKNMCKEAKIEGEFTNHSLFATSSTELFRNNVSQKVIQEFIGYQSIKSLRYLAMQQKMCAFNVLKSVAQAAQHKVTMIQFLTNLPYQVSVPEVIHLYLLILLCTQFPSFAPAFIIRVL